MATSKNALSAEFLYELYATALRYEGVCNILVTHMRKEFLPDRTFQRVQEVIANHYRNYKCAPSYAVLSQTFSSDYDAIELIDTFREYNAEQNTEVVVDMLETYIKGVELQKVYMEVGKLYNLQKQGDAEQKLKEYAQWLSGFTLKTSAYIDVAKTFSLRFRQNRQREIESQQSGLRQVTRFYIPDLDAL